jgi:type III secretion protein U
MSEEKTEEPTRHKLRKAREEGQTARSTDLTQAATMGMVLIAMVASVSMLRDEIESVITTAFLFITSGHDRTVDNMLALGERMVIDALMAIAPVLLVSMIAPIVASLPQTGGVLVTFKPVMPDLEKVSPMSGFKRIFSVRSLIDLLKMFVKAAITFIMAWETFTWVAPLVAGAMYQPLPQLSTMLWDAMMHFIEILAAVAFLIGVLDFQIQHMMLMKKLRMSLEEVKREHKEQDGDPKIKGERKRLARELLEAAPRARVGLANAMIVNPTHYAVAIRYDPKEHPLPRVVAKGIDEHAAELRRLAHEQSIPIIGNPPVARRLFKTDVDGAIPPEMFETVAALLRWVDAIGPQKDDTRSLPC